MIDFAYNCKTFAVRLGKKNAVVFKHVALSIGYAFLILAAYFSDMPNLFIVSFLFLFITSQIIMVICDKNNFNLQWDLFKKLFFVSPFFVIKIFLIIYELIILNLPLTYFLLFIWVFLIDKNSFII